MVVDGAQSTTSSKLIGPTYDIMLFLDGHQATALIDTGSVVSIIPETFVNEFIGVDKMTPLSGDAQFITANGEALQYLGTVEVELTIPSLGIKLHSIFLVVPGAQHVTTIIGTNILEVLDTTKVAPHRQLR